MSNFPLRDEIESLTAYQARRALRNLVAYGHSEQVRRAINRAKTIDSYYVIASDDVGRRTIHAFGSSWSVAFMGRILPGDVGKRVYLKAGILSVENDEQKAARLARTNS